VTIFHLQILLPQQPESLQGHLKSILVRGYICLKKTCRLKYMFMAKCMYQ
jgi:hypothetical protein